MSRNLSLLAFDKFGCFNQICHNTVEFDWTRLLIKNFFLHFTFFPNSLVVYYRHLADFCQVLRSLRSRSAEVCGADIILFDCSTVHLRRQLLPDTLSI